MPNNKEPLKGLIFDIQRYSLHDGPGIRSTVFFKGCPLRCQWCANPESFHKKPEVAYLKKDCIACYACVSACGNNAILRNEDGVWIDRERCAQNFTCAAVCPTGALTVFGRWYTSDEVLKIVLKDGAFYRNSGGGMTLSGGEVLLQSDFAAELLSQAKQAGIQTAVETSGYAPLKDLQKIVDLTDLFLYDIKLVNCKKHRRYTGVDNRLIFENLRWLAKEKKNLIARIPLIPTVNMDDEAVKDFISLIHSLDIQEVNLLPFHQLGQAKYDMMGLDYAFKDIKIAEDETVQAIGGMMAKAGLTVKIGG